jgi:hypothetical protein
MSNDVDDAFEVEEYFAQVPEWIIKAEIPDRAVRMYALLQRYGNGTGRRFPKRATLAEDLSWSLDKVDDSMRDLKTLGAVVVKERWSDDGRVRRSNLYLLRVTNPTTSTHPRRSGGSRSEAATGSRSQAATGSRSQAAHTERTTTQRSLTERSSTPPPPAPPAAAPAPIERAAAPQREAEVSSWTAVFTTADDLEEFAAELRVIRRQVDQPSSRWTTRAVRLAIGKAIAAEYDPSAIPGALRLVARDPATQLPGRVAQAGPWWDAPEVAHLDVARADRQAQQAAHSAALGHKPCVLCSQPDDLDGAGRCGSCAAAGAGPVSTVRSETA